MATNSSVQWRSGNSICRCCLSEGCYKDISTEYFWMGKREVYSEMLAETFDLCISFSKNGGPNSNSRLICEACISRLRDAAEFKRQVKDCEKTFVQLLEPGSSQDTSTVGKEIKKELKLENLFSDDDDDDFLDDTNDFGDDDLDDEPLMKLASKTPKKEPPVQLKSVLSKGQIGLKRKAPAPVVQSKSTPPKKVKIEVKKVSATTSSAKNPEKPKKVGIDTNCPKWNAEVIIRNTTAIPFRSPESQVVRCIYCEMDFIDQPAQFRNHVQNEHPTFTKSGLRHVTNDNFCKVDITELRCKTCLIDFKFLSDAAEHLRTVHGLKLAEKLPIMPYKFTKNAFICGVCNMSFVDLREVGKHFSQHIALFTCDACGKSYMTKTTLNRHKAITHSEKEFCCIRCLKSFDTSQARSEHVQANKRCWHYSCPQCGERFISYSARGSHLLTVHGLARVCNRCGREFNSYNTFKNHYILEHSDRAVTCSYCGKKCVDEKDLSEHIVKHTKTKDYICSECGKNYSRRKSLQQHMWIHKEVKKCICVPCDKHFNQRVCFKAHMRKEHPDVDIPTKNVYKG